jgi:hypothetical protein
MDLKFSKVARKGPVTTVTLSRPEVYNALHIEAHFELNRAPASPRSPADCSGCRARSA